MHKLWESFLQQEAAKDEPLRNGAVLVILDYTLLL